MATLADFIAAMEDDKMPQDQEQPAPPQPQEGEPREPWRSDLITIEASKYDALARKLERARATLTRIVICRGVNDDAGVCGLCTEHKQEAMAVLVELDAEAGREEAKR